MEITEESLQIPYFRKIEKIKLLIATGSELAVHRSEILFFIVRITAVHAQNNIWEGYRLYRIAAILLFVQLEALPWTGTPLAIHRSASRTCE